MTKSIIVVSVGKPVGRIESKMAFKMSTKILEKTHKTFIFPRN